MPGRYRDYNLAMLLLACSGVLAVVLFSQWLHYRGKEADLKKLLASKVETQVKAETAEAPHVELPGLEDYTATIERPLFMEGRRPVTEEAAASEPTAVEKKPLTVKLMGVIFAPDATMGLFVDAQGKYKRLHLHDSIGGWKLAEIKADRVVMEQDEAHEELKLAKPKQKKPPGQQKLGNPPPPFGGANMPGQPLPGQPFPGQQAPPFGPINPNNFNAPEESIEPEQPNEAVDETPIPPEEPLPNDQ